MAAPMGKLSKVFEKIIYSQINTYMSDKFSKYLTGFHKNHNTQHTLLNMIENWKSNLNNGNKIGTNQTISLEFFKGCLPLNFLFHS